MVRAPEPTCVIFVGIPASGKSSFFRAHFVDTHVRVNGDMLRTANRERLLVDACVKGGTSFVVDKTNVTKVERARYIAAATNAGFRVEGYYFESRRSPCVERNEVRAPSERVPAAAIYGMSGRLELPSTNEGFAALYFVRLLAEGGFDVQPWNEEEGLADEVR